MCIYLLFLGNAFIRKEEQVLKVQFFICNHCGNLIAMIKDQGVPITCCGENMQEITDGTSEGAKEKHIPVYHINGETVTVSVKGNGAGDAFVLKSGDRSIEYTVLDANSQTVDKCKQFEINN